MAGRVKEEKKATGAGRRCRKGISNCSTHVQLWKWSDASRVEQLKGKIMAAVRITNKWQPLTFVTYSDCLTGDRSWRTKLLSWAGIGFEFKSFTKQLMVKSFKKMFKKFTSLLLIVDAILALMVRVQRPISNLLKITLKIDLYFHPQYYLNNNSAFFLWCLFVTLTHT